MINQQFESSAFSYGSFVWWTGVVEDRMDPKQMGRLKVRVLGYHTKDKGKIPTNKLAWAVPMQSITSAAMSGIGYSPTGIVEGTWVIGFFRDGHMAQDPIIMGCLGGIPEKSANSNDGFNDPTGNYPLSDFIGEPDVNRLARGDTTDTSIQYQNDAVDSGVSVAFGGSWSEPASPYAAEYPFNHVRQSESGHVEEWDDTPGAERLRRWHRSGTFEEVHPDGTKVQKVVNNNYSVILGDDSIHVTGNCNITVDGNVNLKTGGNLRCDVGGNFDLNAGGNINMKAGGTLKTNSGGLTYIDAPRIDLNLPGPPISF